jgi:hypothetical protein
MTGHEKPYEGDPTLEPIRAMLETLAVDGAQVSEHPSGTLAEAAPPPVRRERLSRFSRADRRANFLVPIHFSLAGDIPMPEATAALAGVVDALEASGQARDLNCGWS